MLNVSTPKKSSIFLETFILKDLHGSWSADLRRAFVTFPDDLKPELLGRRGRGLVLPVRWVGAQDRLQRERPWPVSGRMPLVGQLVGGRVV